MQRVKADLETGILTKLRLQREQQLEQIVAGKCYSDPNISYMEGQACEDFIYKNDFKLNMINKFVDDHLPKQLMTYQKCISGEQMSGLADNVDKDRAFLKCHNEWVGNIKDKFAFDMELKARQLLGGSAAQQL